MDKIKEKVAVCSEYVETTICEYLGFKTVFSRWMPEQVSRDQNCWSIMCEVPVQCCWEDEITLLKEQRVIRCVDKSKRIILQ
jgi:hypothetical protein